MFAVFVMVCFVLLCFVVLLVVVFVVVCVVVFGLCLCWLVDVCVLFLSLFDVCNYFGLCCSIGLWCVFGLMLVAFEYVCVGCVLVLFGVYC